MFRVQPYVRMIDFLKKPTIDLPITITFDDGRSPYKFDIPVVLKNRRVAFLLPILGLLFSLSLSIYQWFNPTSDFNSVRWFSIGIGCLVVAFLTYSGWDIWKTYRSTQQFLAKLKVETEAAKAFADVSLEEQRKMQLLLSLRLQELTTPKEKSLKTVMDEIGTRAEARGLTPEILKSLLRDK